jgi:thiamine pyrophosphate-dependent acetolactate synthase large subunit-like protein
MARIPQNKPGYGVDLSAQPDAAAVAAAAGAAGFTVPTTPELASTLEKAIATVRAGQTAVVNVFLARWPRPCLRLGREKYRQTSQFGRRSAPFSP